MDNGTFVETSTGFKSDIKELKLYIDATISIGRRGHEYADLLAFSSCKGLFGITGAAFIGYNHSLHSYKIKNHFFTMNLEYGK